MKTRTKRKCIVNSQHSYLITRSVGHHQLEIAPFTLSLRSFPFVGSFMRIVDVVGTRTSLKRTVWTPYLRYWPYIHNMCSMRPMFLALGIHSSRILDNFTPGVSLIPVQYPSRLPVNRKNRVLHICTYINIQINLGSPPWQGKSLLVLLQIVRVVGMWYVPRRASSSAVTISSVFWPLAASHSIDSENTSARECGRERVCVWACMRACVLGARCNKSFYMFIRDKARQQWSKDFITVRQTICTAILLIRKERSLANNDNSTTRSVWLFFASR